MASLLILLGITTWMAYPALRYGFILHDDSLEILANRHFYPFDGAALEQIWKSPDFSKVYIPVNYTVLGGLTEFSRWWHHLDRLAQPTPDVFHAAGVLLHLVNSCLVFGFLRRVADETGEPFPWLALSGSLAFALHPAQVESWARAGNITVTLGGTLALLGLGSFVSCWSSPGRKWGRYAAATLFFVLAVLTRPTAVALPLAAFAIAWGSRSARSNILMLWLLPWLAISVAYTLISLRLQSSDPSALFSVTALLNRTIISADCLLWYAAQTVWPAILTVDHGLTPDVVLGRRFAWFSVIGLLSLLMVLFFTARKTHRWIFAGCLFFIALLLPVSGLIPTPNRESLSIVYDRHLYLPLLGATMVFVSLLSKLDRKWQRGGAIAVVCLLGLQARNYLAVWSHSIPLFQHVVRVNPASWYGHGQLGTALLTEGHPAEAVPALARALELNAQLTDARINLGMALLALGQNTEAEQVLRKAVERDKLQDGAFNNLAVALLRRQAWAEAEGAAREALRLNASHLLARTNLALALSGQGRHQAASAEAMQTLSARPDYPQAWRVLAEIRFNAGQVDGGIEALTRACQLDPYQQEWQTLLNAKQHAAPQTIDQSTK